MANYVYIELDTTPPASPGVSADLGAQYTTDLFVDLNISTADGDTVGYQMKIWGDVDLTNDTNVQGSEVNSTWITYATSKQVKLSDTDGSKVVYLKVRDDVHNESSVTSDSIILDSTLPVVTTNTPDTDVISKVAGKNVASFSFTVDSAYDEYKVKVVGATGASHDTGTTIGTANGSTNVTGIGTFAAATPINVSIYGTDLEAASAGDGEKIIKVFAKDEAGNWSA